MTPFSERLGITQPKTIQIANLDMDLRNSLWNVCREYFFIFRTRQLADDYMYIVASKLYKDLYRKPIEALPYDSSKFVEAQLSLFQMEIWYKVLDIVEFLHTLFRDRGPEQRKFENQINEVLEREKSAYRFIVGKLARITNELEMQELEQAARHGDRFAPVAEHVRTALELYSKKPQPDYRNSIKESISAVESAAKIITGQPKATLGDAVKVIDKEHSLHESFKSGISKLYGYTSDEGGIRHSLIEATNIDETDALYMLVSCSAFANYLISRYDKQP
jgi:AbiJ N-terminal domain 4